MGAQRKGRDDGDGDSEVRLLQDGTFGPFVMVLDQCRAPVAPDIQQAMREQAEADAETDLTCMIHEAVWFE